MNGMDYEMRHAEWNAGESRAPRASPLVLTLPRSPLHYQPATMTHRERDRRRFTDDAELSATAAECGDEFAKFAYADNFGKASAAGRTRGDRIKGSCVGA